MSFDEAVRQAMQTSAGGSVGEVLPGDLARLLAHSQLHPGFEEYVRLLHEMKATQSPEDAPPIGAGFLGRAEPAMTIGTGVAGAVPGGLAGLTSLAAGQGAEAASQRTQDVQGALTYAPQTPEGQGRLESVLDVLKLQEIPGDAAGDFLNKYVGPGTATGGKMVVDELTDPTNIIPGLGVLAGAGVGAIKRVGRGIMRDADGRIVARVGRGTIRGNERRAVTAALADNPQLHAEAVELVRKARREHPAGPGMMEDPITGKVVPETGWKEFEITGAKVSDAGNVTLAYKQGMADGFDFNYDLRTGKRYTGAARARRVAHVGRKLSDEVLEIKAAAAKGSEPAIRVMKALHWYRDVRRKLFDTFGGGAIAAGELEAGFSPNTRLSINHDFAMKVLKRFMSGDFDDQLTVLDDMLRRGIEPTDAQWSSLVPKQPSGDPYGMNGRNAMRVMLDAFRDQPVGMAPKMRNYGKNLLGMEHGPTIDLIAARTVQRMSGRKRVIPELNRVPGLTMGMVADKEGNIIPGKTVKTKGGSKTLRSQPELRNRVVGLSDQYGFATDVFNDALVKLQQADPAFKDVLPDDLQAMMWVREGDLWIHNRWMASKEAAMLDTLVEGENLGRMQGGISAQRDAPPTAQVQQTVRETILNGLMDDDDVFFARAPDTEGRFTFDGVDVDEVAFDAEFVIKRDSETATSSVVSNVFEAAKKADQDAAFVSKVIPYEEGMPAPANGRPGVEIYLDPRTASDVLPQLEKLVKSNHSGFTIIKDSLFRADGSDISQNPSGVVGVRLQWVPEFDGTASKLAEGADLDVLRRQQLNSFLDLADQAGKMDGVIDSRTYWYDTLVAERGDYDAYIRRAADAGGVPSGSAGGATRRRREFGRSLRENVAGGTGSDVPGGGPEVPGAGDVLRGGPTGGDVGGQLAAPLIEGQQ